MKPFIPKEDQEIPDNYSIKVDYVSGKSEEFQLASHSLNQSTQMLEFWTEDDLVNWIPLSSVKRIEFDKRFSKMMAIKEKQLRQEKENAASSV